MTWYRRREQPIRIAVWYGTNGVASMLVPSSLMDCPSSCLRFSTSTRSCSSLLVSPPLLPHPVRVVHSRLLFALTTVAFHSDLVSPHRPCPTRRLIPPAGGWTTTPPRPNSSLPKSASGPSFPCGLALLCHHLLREVRSSLTPTVQWLMDLVSAPLSPTPCTCHLNLKIERKADSRLAAHSLSKASDSTLGRLSSSTSHSDSSKRLCVCSVVSSPPDSGTAYLVPVSFTV
jgi:hypothetical protein